MKHEGARAVKPIKLSIGEIARVLGISAKTIRHYHDIGLIPEPERLENGYRIYGLAELRQIQSVRRLQGFGFSLKQIQIILDSDESDADLHRFLVQRDAELSETIDQLQRQQSRVRAALSGETPVDDLISTREILETTMRPTASGLTDVLLQVEAVVLDQLDSTAWHPGYASYWEFAAKTVAGRLLMHEHLVILWLERYLAVEVMAPEDKQAHAWLTELQTSSAGSILLSSLRLPRSTELPLDEQERLEWLLPLLLFEHATPLQREFLQAIFASMKRR